MATAQVPESGFTPPRVNHNLNLDRFAPGNLANYLGFEDVDNLALTVPVNFIFVGFTGDGNLGLTLREAELRHWFQHIDLVVQVGYRANRIVTRLPTETRY